MDKRKIISPIYRPRTMNKKLTNSNIKKHIRNSIVLYMYKNNKTNKTYIKLKKLLERKNIFISINTIFNIIKRDLFKDKKQLNETSISK